jgi:hypothetical protein
MIQGRIEPTPPEQLAELRKARDRYNALADQLRDDPDLPSNLEEKLERERDARRIASAYDKSIANMIASCRIRRIQTNLSTSGSARTSFAVIAFLVVAGGAAFFAFAQPPAHPAKATQISAAGARANWAAPARESRNGSAVSPAQAQDSDKNIGYAPSPTSVTKTLPAEQPPQNIRVVETKYRSKYTRHRLHPANTVPDAGHADSGFVAKVLQQDGTLQEQYFPATAPR